METVIEEENYRLLGNLVLNFATRELHKIFLARYEYLTKEKWGKKRSSAKQFFEGRPAEERRRSYTNSSAEDRKKLEGDAHEWDIAMVDMVLSNIDFSAQNKELKDQHDEENKQVKEIKAVRNKYSHLTHKQISQSDFQVWWKKAKEALIALGSLESEIDEIKASTNITSFKLVHPPTRYFTGRKELLQKIHKKMLECSEKQECLDRIVFLSGLGGIGKSELARMYAKTYIGDPIIQNVAWIDAADITSIKASFVSIANKFRIPTEDKELKEIVENVYDFFSNYIKNGLFIFDNSKQLNDNPFGIHEYLPVKASVTQRPLILLTSREQNWDIPNKTNVISVTKLSQEESIELLEKKFRLAKENKEYCAYRNHVAELANALQGYPLGLALATSNIPSKKLWIALKCEIDSYLERLSVPGGDWIEDDQRRAATNYKFIMENVWELTLEKIKYLKRKGKNAIALLNILAYLPSDQIRKDEIERIFETCYSTNLSTKHFDILQKYSLIKIDTSNENTEEPKHFVRIHQLVQLTTRNKLERQKDVSYALQLCKYFSYRAYKQPTIYPHERTIMSLHTFLKEREWPEKSVQFSALLCSIMTFHISITNTKHVFEMVQDIYNFLNMAEIETAKAVHGNDIVNLCFLCMFAFNQNRSEGRMRVEFCLDTWELFNVFRSLVAPSTVFALKSTERPKTLQEHLHLMCMRLLPTLIKLNKESTSQLIPTMISALNSTPCSSSKYFKKVCRALWTFLECNVFGSLTLLRPVFQEHFIIYSHINSKLELSKYWNELFHKDKPLDLRFMERKLNRIKDNRDINNGKMGPFQAADELLEAFIEAGGLQMMGQRIECFSKLGNTSGSWEVLCTVRSLALYLNDRQDLVKSVEFLTAFWDLTKLIFDDLFFALDTFTCIMGWFSLFANHKQESSDKSCLSSIHTVAPLLNEILNRLKQLSDQDKYIKDDFDNEYVIRTFLETYKNDPDCLAVRTARRIFRDDIAYLFSAEFLLKPEVIGLGDKIKSVQRANKNTWRLLKILSYLKDATPKAKIGALFKFVFSQDLTEDAFTTLKDHLLLYVNKEKDLSTVTDPDGVQINDSVKLWIRAKLLNENDFLCLIGVFNFAILETLKPQYGEREWPFWSLHKYLSDFRWPQNSTHISMIFSAILARTEFNSLSMLEDVYEFSRSSHVTRSKLNTEHLRLFQLCLFWLEFRHNKGDVGQTMWTDLNLNKEFLEDIFLASIKPSVEHFLHPQREAELIQDFCLKIPIYLLARIPNVPFFMRNADAELLNRIDFLILESLHATIGCSPENVLRLFWLLWKFYQHARPCDSVSYLAAILEKHSQVYTAYASSLYANLEDYWNERGPLNLYIVLLYTEMRSCADKHDFVQLTAYEWDHAQKFIEFPEFIEKLSIVTQIVLEEDTCFEEVTCALLWFALFARLGAKKKGQKCYFFVDVVALQLEKLISRIESRYSVAEMSEPLIGAAKRILNSFLETFSNNSDSLAFKTAATFLDYVQF